MSLDTTTIGDGTTMGKGWDGKPGKILSKPWNWAWTLTPLPHLDLNASLF